MTKEQILYAVAYFKTKIEAIPEEAIGRALLEKHCILTHCGMDNYAEPTEEAMALLELFGGDVTPRTTTYGYRYYNFEDVWRVNDGHESYLYLGKTPKERLLNRIQEIKKQNE